MPESRRAQLTAQLNALPSMRLKKTSWAWLGFVTACLALMAVGASLNVNLYQMPLVFGLGLAIAHTGTLALTVARPAVGMLASLVPLALMPLLATPMGAAPMPFSVVAMMTQVLVVCVTGLRSHWMLAGAAWLLSVAVGTAVIYRSVPGAATPGSEANVVVFASVSGGLMVASVITQQWQNIRLQLVAERTLSAEEQSMRRLAEERTRIARELHDVVAHGMSAVVVQATTAPFRHPDMSSALVAEFEDIAASSRRAMSEMRSMLGALRSADAGRELGPQPGLADLGLLVTSARSAGITVTVEGLGTLDADVVGEVIGLTAYRIVQEALSNVIRHAPGAAATVRLAVEGSHLLVEVANEPSDVGAVMAQLDRGPDAGHGLMGMRERASIVGGSVLCTPTADGGFQVSAHLPLAEPGA
ncbi:sensor histidine kinase [Arthrobacter sp. 35W]|uniref:sensor histidine kinase n=1 Tax=Arthrobacter sp. 35W TaxID=1132441 RepID=UPI00040AEBFC|nr:histidine kinase [Arthrobacter sp. 35W]